MELAKKDDLLAGIGSMLAQERTREARELTGADLALLRPKDWADWREFQAQVANPARSVLPAFGSALSIKQASHDTALPTGEFRKETPSLDAAYRAIKAAGISIRYDRFHRRVEFGGYERLNDESIDDTVLQLRKHLKGRLEFDPGGKHTFDAVRLLALENGYDPVREYLDGLSWDGVPRLDAWLSTYLGAEDTPLNRAIGRTTLVGAVRRVRRPGSKFDTMLVLESPQGKGKSTALHILAGGDDNFSDQYDFRLPYKDMQEILTGKWIVEAPEMNGLGRADVQKAKQDLSRTHDRARPAFGRTVEDVPRRCIMIGTTNDSEYLRDQTGNRRFLPVAIGTVDLDTLRADRDQLWAEAAAAEAEAGPLITIPPELWGAAAERQASRVVVDPWQDILEEGLEKYAKVKDGQLRIQSADIFPLILQRNGIRVADPKRIADAMRRLGWTGPVPVRWGDKAVRSYVKPATT